jgi:nucleoside-diphosphate-sugar epimerase
VGELLNMIKNIADIDKEIVFSAGTPGDQRGIYADISLAQKTFGFACSWTLEKGLKQMVAWAKSTKW